MSYEKIIKYNQFKIDYSFNKIIELNKPYGDPFIIGNIDLNNITICMSGNILSLKKPNNDVSYNVSYNVYSQTSTIETSKAKTIIYVDTSSNNIEDSKIIYINGGKPDYIQTAPFTKSKSTPDGNIRDISGYNYDSRFDISLNQFVKNDGNKFDYSLNNLQPLFIDNKYVIYNDIEMKRITMSNNYNLAARNMFIYENYISQSPRNNLSAIKINDAIYLSYTDTNGLHIKKVVFTNNINEPFITQTIQTILTNNSITYFKILFTDELITFFLGRTTTRVDIYMLHKNTFYNITNVTSLNIPESIINNSTPIIDCFIYRNTENDKINCLTLIILSNVGVILRTFDYVALKNSIYNGNLNKFVVLQQTLADKKSLVDKDIINPFILYDNIENYLIYYNGNDTLKILENNETIHLNLSDLITSSSFSNNTIKKAYYITTNSSDNGKKIIYKTQINTSENSLNTVLLVPKQSGDDSGMSYASLISEDSSDFYPLITAELDSDQDDNKSIYNDPIKNRFIQDLHKSNFIFNNIFVTNDINNDYMFMYWLKDYENVIFICEKYQESEKSYYKVFIISDFTYIDTNFTNNPSKIFPYDPSNMSLFYNKTTNKTYISYIDANSNNLNNKIISQINFGQEYTILKRSISYDSINYNYVDNPINNINNNTKNTATLINKINVTSNKNINYYTENLVQDEYIKKLLYCNDLLNIFLTNLGRLMYLYSDNRNGSYAKLHTPSDESFTLYEIPYSFSDNKEFIIDNIYYAQDATATYNSKMKTIEIALINNLGYSIITFNDQSQPCFLSTTKVLTINSNGEEEYKEISKLLSGDYVKTPTGKTCKIKHCGYTPPFTMMDEMDYPRIIPKDYFGDKLPEEQIYASGWHAIYLPKDKTYPLNIQRAIKLSKSMLSIQNELESNIYNKVFLFTFTELKVIKSIQEIQELTGKPTANYYNIELEDPTQGYIVSGLPVESLSQDLWSEFRFTDNQ